MRNLSFYLLLIGLTMGLTTCDSHDNCDDMIWDFVNYEFLIYANDSETGKNLFDPQTQNNLLDKGVWVTYKDETYNIVPYTCPQNERSTKATYCPPLALRSYPAESLYDAPKLCLGFGNFAPERNYRNETFTIHWADGTTDVVKFDCYITWNKCDPTVHKAIYLNGNKLSDKEYPNLTFRKQGKTTE